MSEAKSLSVFQVWGPVLVKDTFIRVVGHKECTRRCEHLQNDNVFKSELSGYDVQCFIFSRNIGWVTPKINYFNYLKKILSGSKYPENILFRFENRSTDDVYDWHCGFMQRLPYLYFQIEPVSGGNKVLLIRVNYDIKWTSLWQTIFISTCFCTPDTVRSGQTSLDITNRFVYRPVIGSPNAFGVSKFACMFSSPVHIFAMLLHKEYICLDGIIQ